MDLLGDLGTSDQLTATRAENAVLQQKVKELSLRVKELVVENESLKAEVEIYRKEAALPSFSSLALGKAPSGDAMDLETNETSTDDFVRAGNGIYPKNNEITLSNLHDQANLLCCALSPDETILATGGADRHLKLCAWGSASSGENSATQAVVKSAVGVDCQAPVICTAFSPKMRGVLATGSMDGSIHLVYHESLIGQGLHAKQFRLAQEYSHRKFVKKIAWSPTEPIMATSSADGSIQIFKVTSSFDMNGDKELKADKIESLHLSGAVEALEFYDNQLVVYARGVPYLSFFDLGKDCAQTKVNLNTSTGGAATTGGFEDHVSFAILDMHVWQDKYLAAATDTSRNMIMDLRTQRQVRNLYGHQNDHFSNPKVAWSSSGQYLLGNTQEEAVVCIWDLASSQIVERLKGHTSPVRDIFSSASTDTVVTTSFDKTTRFWFGPDSY